MLCDTALAISSSSASPTIMLGKRPHVVDDDEQIVRTPYRAAWSFCAELKPLLPAFVEAIAENNGSLQNFVLPRPPTNHSSPNPTLQRRKPGRPKKYATVTSFGTSTTWPPTKALFLECWVDLERICSEKGYDKELVPRVFHILTDCRMPNYTHLQKLIGMWKRELRGASPWHRFRDEIYEYEGPRQKIARINVQSSSPPSSSSSTPITSRCGSASTSPSSSLSSPTSSSSSPTSTSPSYGRRAISASLLLQQSHSSLSHQEKVRRCCEFLATMRKPLSELALRTRAERANDIDAMICNLSGTSSQQHYLGRLKSLSDDEFDALVACNLDDVNMLVNGLLEAINRRYPDAVSSRIDVDRCVGVIDQFRVSNRAYSAISSLLPKKTLPSLQTISEARKRINMELEQYVNVTEVDGITYCHANIVHILTTILREAIPHELLQCKEPSVLRLKLSADGGVLKYTCDRRMVIFTVSFLDFKWQHSQIGTQLLLACNGKEAYETLEVAMRILEPELIKSLTVTGIPDAKDKTNLSTQV